MTTTLDLTADIIDVRDLIERYEELENESDGLPNAEERYQLSCILSDLKGEGGDEQWRGDWYPLTLIRESYFQDYAQELAEDIGAVNRDATWPNNCIDWEQAARELRMDYTSTQIDGVTYFFR
jgi:antirestriction protein